MGVGVVAEREPGRGFGGAGGRDLQVEALHAAVGEAGRDLEAVAPTLAGTRREQAEAAAVDAAANAPSPPASSSSPPNEPVPGANRAPLTQAPLRVSLARLIM